MRMLFRKVTLTGLLLAMTVLAVVACFFYTPYTPSGYLGHCRIRMATCHIRDAECDPVEVYLRIDSNSAFDPGASEAIGSLSPGVAFVSIANREVNDELLTLLRSIPNLKGIQFDSVVFSGSLNSVDLLACKKLSTLEFFRCKLHGIRINVPTNLNLLSLDYSTISDNTLASLKSVHLEHFSTNYTNITPQQLGIVSEIDSPEFSAIGTGCLLSELHTHLPYVCKVTISSAQVDTPNRFYEVYDIQTPVSLYEKANPKSKFWRITFQ